MKTLIVFLAAFTALPAFATSPVRESNLLERKQNSGFVPPEYRFVSQCQVKSGHTFMSTTFGYADPETSYRKTVYTAALPNEAAVKAALAEAARGILQEEAGPVDGPTDEYTGTLEGSTVDQRIKLRRSGTDGRNHRNASPAVPALVELAELNCRIPPR